MSISNVEPDYFLCPITHEIMEDPFIDTRGHSFERSAIIEWIRDGHDTCPMGNEFIAEHLLFPNRGLREAIEAYQNSNASNMQLGAPLNIAQDEAVVRSLSSQQIEPNSNTALAINRVLEEMPMEQIQNYFRVYNRGLPPHQRVGIDQAISITNGQRWLSPRAITSLHSAFNSMRFQEINTMHDQLVSEANRKYSILKKTISELDKKNESLELAFLEQQKDHQALKTALKVGGFVVGGVVFGALLGPGMAYTGSIGTATTEQLLQFGIGGGLFGGSVVATEIPLEEKITGQPNILLENYVEAKKELEVFKNRQRQPRLQPAQLSLFDSNH